MLHIQLRTGIVWGIKDATELHLDPRGFFKGECHKMKKGAIEDYVDTTRTYIVQFHEDMVACTWYFATKDTPRPATKEDHIFG